MKNTIVSSVFIFLLIVTSCTKAPFLTITGPNTFTFTREGGTQLFTFSCNRDWSLTSTEGWIKITPSSGTATDEEITVNIICSPNATYDPRSATIFVKTEGLSEPITITQDTGIGLIVSPTTFELTNAAQTIEIEVQNNIQYSVLIEDDGAKWIEYTGTKALTTAKATFAIKANEGYDSRESTITFKQTDGALIQTVSVRQSQTNGLFITTPEYELSNEQHTLTVEVKANVDFEVTSQTDWIKYTSTSTKALSPSQITLQVDANDTYDDRVGYVVVKQVGGDLVGTIIIRQDEKYGIVVSQESVSIGSEEQIVEVEVRYNVDLEVIIPESAKGVMIKTVEYDDSESTKALTTRNYRFEITANNSYDSRETTITFKQKEGAISGTVEIYQERLPINLSASGTANCYIAPSSGEYYFDCSRRGNTTNSVGAVSSVDVVWETFNTTEKPLVGDLISSAWLKDDTIHFKVPRKYLEGNALIAVKDNLGVILWSWHIWVISDDLEKLSQTYLNGAGTLMDRNLGALSALPGDHLSAGLLYQWGRKDPFINGVRYGSSEYAVSTLAWPTGYTFANHENGTIEYTIKNPTVWMHCNSYNEDWLYTGDASHDDTRWNENKGEYDPCPNGWKVPSGGNGGFWVTAFGRNDTFDGYTMWDSEHVGFHLNLLVDPSKEAWFPMSHAKNLYEGGIGNTGDMSANLWTCTYGNQLVLWKGGKVEPNRKRERTWGFSIRCQRIED